MKKIIALLLAAAIAALLIESCYYNEPKNKFEDPRAEYVILEKGERLRGIAFMNAELYVRTVVDTTPPKKHYVQKYVNRGFVVKLIIQEQ